MGKVGVRVEEGLVPATKPWSVSNIMCRGERVPVRADYSTGKGGDKPTPLCGDPVEE